MRRFIHSRDKNAGTFVADFDTRNVSTGSSASNQLKLNFNALNQFNTPRTVDWGDGAIDIIPGGIAAFTHTYSVEGVYTVKIKANTFAFTFNNTNDRLKILEVKSWGTYTIVTNTFFGCANLVLSNNTGKPTVESAGGSFRNCTSITTINGINDWDWSATTRIDAFLRGCTFFNQSLNLNTVNVTNAGSSFMDCTSLNSPILLNFSKATTIAELFSGCTLFSPPSIYIDAPLATTIQSAFNGCPLNTTQSFYVSAPKAISVGGLLTNKPNFNTTTFYLDVTEATNLQDLLSGAKTFNPTNFTLISKKSTSWRGVFFNCWVFNKPLPDVDTSFTTSLYAIFYNAYAFNQDLSHFNVANVTDMVHALNTVGFTQSLITWNFNKDVQMNEFMSSKSSANYSAENYDILLQRVATAVIGTGRTQTAKVLRMGTIKYTSVGKPYRDALVADGWTISDGGMI